VEITADLFCKVGMTADLFDAICTVFLLSLFYSYFAFFGKRFSYTDENYNPKP